VRKAVNEFTKSTLRCTLDLGLGDKGQNFWLFEKPHNTSSAYATVLIDYITATIDNITCIYCTLCLGRKENVTPASNSGVCSRVFH